MLMEQARLSPPVAESRRINWMHQLAEKLRIKNPPAVARVWHKAFRCRSFSLSSQEGVALMCSWKRCCVFPDKLRAMRCSAQKSVMANRQPVLLASPSLFVNAATSAAFYRRLVSTHNCATFKCSLNRIIGKSGEPLIRKGVDMAMRAFNGRGVRLAKPLLRCWRMSKTGREKGSAILTICWAKPR